MDIGKVDRGSWIGRIRAIDNENKLAMVDIGLRDTRSEVIPIAEIGEPSEEHIKKEHDFHDGDWVWCCGLKTTGQIKAMDKDSGQAIIDIGSDEEELTLISLTDIGDLCEQYKKEHVFLWGQDDEEIIFCPKGIPYREYRIQNYPELFNEIVEQCKKYFSRLEGSDES